MLVVRSAFAIAFVLLLCGPLAGADARPSADCSRTSVGLAPLTELKTRKYRGYQGGLYPNGSNSPPPAYLKRGISAANAMRGRVVLLSIGMSNATHEFRTFIKLTRRESDLNPRLTIVDGAISGADAVKISAPGATYWSAVDKRLAAAGVTPAQVQVVWLKEAVARPSERFPADARRLQTLLRKIVSTLDRSFPNLKLVYVSSRTYGGYATKPLNPEPYAYQSGFAFKWLVADRIAGRIKGPWVGWGPYLWADGEHARTDGLSWSCRDFRNDGTHPSTSGRLKVAERLLRFLKTNPTAKPWFMAKA